MKKQKRRSSGPGNGKALIPVVILLAVLAAVLVCLMVYTLKDGGNTGQPGVTTLPPQTTVPQAPTAPPVMPTLPPETTQPDDKLPYSLEDGKLEIESLFQYTGLNPDCYWEEGSNTGAVVLHNRSEEYLESLEMTITMTDGVQLQFRIYDIPAGQTVWAYEAENTAYDADTIIDNVICTAVFREDNGLTPEQVTVSVNMMDVTLTNVSGEELSNLEVRCHNMVDGILFGGTAYVYPIENLISGGTVTVTAFDCFLGDAAVSIVDFAK